MQYVLLLVSISCGNNQCTSVADIKLGAEWNPLSQGGANLASSLTGRDMTISQLSGAQKNGGNVSGELLSTSKKNYTWHCRGESNLQQ